MAHNRTTVEQPFITLKDGITTEYRPADPPYHFDQPYRQGQEKPKIALKWKIPYLEILIHTIALGTIVALAWASLRKKYWKDFDLKDDDVINVELNAWQLASKVHELFMLASLSFMVFYHARRLLIGKNGIPFGLLTAPFSTGSPAMIFNTSFQAGFTRNWKFGLLLLLVCILSTILGPSSAIIMIPSLGWFQVKEAELPGEVGWPSQGEKIWYFQVDDKLDGKVDLWPTVLDASVRWNESEAAQCADQPFDLEFGCPSSGFADIVEWFVSTTFTDSRGTLSFGDFYSSAKREMGIYTIPGSAYDAEKVEPTQVYTTVVTDLTLSSLGTFNNYAQRSNLNEIDKIAYPQFRVAKDTPIYQPVVHTNCHMTLFSGDWDREDISFPSLKSSFVDDGSYAGDPYILKSDSKLFDGLPSLVSRFTWLKDTREVASSSLLALAVMPVIATNETVDTYQGSAVVACSIDARWAASHAMFQPRNSTTVFSNVSGSVLETLGQPYSDSRRSELALSEKPIDLKLDWAALLNGNQTDSGASSTNYTAMAAFLSLPLTKLSDVNANVTTVFAPNTTTADLNGAIEEATSKLIGVVIADGIARSVSVSSPWFMDKDTSRNTDEQSVFIPLRGYLIPESKQLINTDKIDHYILRVLVDQYGYGYGIRNKTFYFAMACLLTYTVFTLVHIGYVLIASFVRKQLRGSSWEDVGELVALAVNSTPTHRLHGTSAGISKRATWKNIVKVREVSDDHLELCFVDHERDEVGEKIRKGKAYY